MAPTARVHAFDWLRGLAVLVMIQTHALVLLSPAARASALYPRVVRVDGLVAPAFIFSAGFALALVQVRAGLAGRRREQARKSLRRVRDVLVVAALLNAIWFAPWRQPLMVLRLDILHCIGLSLLLVLPVLLALARHPAALRVVTLLLALGLFAVSPLTAQLEGWPTALLTTRPGVLDATTGASFPLLPWAGYVFLGASFGATVGAMRQERELWAWWALLMGLGALLWWQDQRVAALYPPHDYWLTNPAEAAQRWTKVLGLVGLFRLVELRLPTSTATRGAKWLAAFGTSSLSAYFFHEVLLYQHHVGVFSRFFRDRAEWPLFWLLVAALVGLTWLCVRAWDRVEPAVRARLRLT